MSLINKLSALLLALVLSMSFNALAEEFTYPKENPTVSITFPNDWKVEGDENNFLHAMPKDESMYFGFLPLPADITDDQVGEFIQKIADEVIEGFEATGDTSTLTVNGIDLVFVEGAGKNKETKEPVNFSFAFFTPNKDPNNMMAFLYFGTPESEAKYKTQMESVIKSIKNPN